MPLPDGMTEAIRMAPSSVLLFREEQQRHRFNTAAMPDDGHGHHAF